MSSQKVFIDTNIIVRILLGEKTDHYIKAVQLLQNIEDRKLYGFISILVLHEIVYVMHRFYKLSYKDLIPQLIILLQLPHIRVVEIKKKQAIAILTLLQKKNIDFTDAYLVYFSKLETKAIASFDKDIGKSSTLKYKM